MKKILIFLLVAAVVIVGYILIKSPEKLDLIGKSDTGAGEDISGRQYDSPSANENGTYSIDKKYSSFSLLPTGQESVDLNMKSGNLIIKSGSVSGGTILMSASGLNDIKGLNALVDNEIKLEVKALVFEQTKSTIDNLVYRVDTELTMNGKTYPLSFDSIFIYRPGDYYIRGQAVPDWKNWGIVLDEGNNSMALNIAIKAVK